MCLYVYIYMCVYTCVYTLLTSRVSQDLEKVLDVFNITLVRQQAHMEVDPIPQSPPGLSRLDPTCSSSSSSSSSR